MDIVIDTDILSTFGKIMRFDLLSKLFPKSKFFVSPKVYSDIIIAKEKGYIFAEYIVSLKLSVVPLKGKDIDVVRAVKENENLGWGEAESIVLAKNNKMLFLSNDYRANKVASKLGVEYFNLPMILRQLYKQKIISKSDLHRLVEEIETKDRIVLLGKEMLFEE